MINRTIERMRRTRAWILNPSCLIDGFLDQIEKLRVAVLVPRPAAGLRYSEVRIETRREPFGA